MKTIQLFIILVCFAASKSFGQVPLATAYFQDFGTTDITTWTNNTTFLGWYSTDGTPLHQDVTTANPNNTGSFYSYECNGDNDQKIGTRASGGTGTLEYGLRLSNTSGATIDFLLVEFDWYQFSVAASGNNLNTIAFSYQIGATVTSLTAGAWTAFGALDFSNTIDTVLCSGSMYRGLPCTEMGHNTACINLTIPAGEEIMLKWTDVNDACNDHHMAIDNVLIGIGTELTCSFILPITLTNFSVEQKERSNLLSWVTSSEANSSHFEIEASIDGINFNSVGERAAAGNSSSILNYSFEHQFETNHPIIYYRLKSVDIDGKFEYSTVLSVNRINENLYFSNGQIHLNNFSPLHNATVVRMYNMKGKVVYEDVHNNNDLIPWNYKGVYLLELPEYGIIEKIISY